VKKKSHPILPGSTLGILGGGQLGRMMAMAARTLGYHVRALDPDASCASRFVVDKLVTASFEDADAAAELARGCDVVTLEIEKVSQASLKAAAKLAPVRPSATVLEIIQDRIKQKTWLDKHGFPVGPFSVARTANQLAGAALRMRAPAYVKAARGGYDGRGQFYLTAPEMAGAAWTELGGFAPRRSGPLACVVERALSIDAEVSILVARSPSGETAVYPPSLNHHEDRILEHCVLPAPISPKIAKRATEIARAIAEAIEVIGLLVVEFFITTDGKLLVNELAPRPHNTFHGTEVGCLTSQFEQAVRAVCDLPLGSTEPVRSVAVYNLLGELWLSSDASPRGSPAFDRALALPGVRVHLYGKREARPGRKMGHLSAAAKTPKDAVALVKKARALL
jgi:5-(carboxyamino)imidazole ribonucleotide synthase